MKKYELIPTDSHKSFYHKANVCIMNNGDKILTSYFTDVIKMTKRGKLYRLCSPDKFSATTLRHIMAFCGLNKAEASSLPLEKF